MTNTAQPKWSTVIDAVLIRDTQEGSISLTVYNADESKADDYGIDAVIMRAAQLEATAWIKEQGWEPVGRWEADEAYDLGDGALNMIRKFKKATA
jgi:hypothetical protein